MMVDPAHPAFEHLPWQQQAAIYVFMGWNKASIAEELGKSRDAVRYWTDPEYREAQRKRALARKVAMRERRAA